MHQVFFFHIQRRWHPHCFHRRLLQLPLLHFRGGGRFVLPQSRGRSIGGATTSSATGANPAPRRAELVRNPVRLASRLQTRANRPSSGDCARLRCDRRSKIPPSVPAAHRYPDFDFSATLPKAVHGALLPTNHRRGRSPRPIVRAAHRAPRDGGRACRAGGGIRSVQGHHPLSGREGRAAQRAVALRDDYARGSSSHFRKISRIIHNCHSVLLDRR
mmetsp:Transcript_2222/g.4771  ORF Transcript_2222/g.4771 Transcript_2222/m.4771 type:complete len:216 (-) Transcript_2222:1321-1968(-)